MKSYYSNYELLHAWNAYFYMEATAECDDLRISEVYAEQTQSALEDNLEKEMIVKYEPTNEVCFRSDLDDYSSYSDFFDYSVDKGTVEVVRMNNGHIATVNENGVQIEFVPLEDSTGFDLLRCVENYSCYSNIDEYIEILKELGISDSVLLSKAIAEYYRYNGIEEKTERKEPYKMEYIHVLQKYNNNDFVLACIPMTEEELSDLYESHQTDGFSVRGSLEDIITELKTMEATEEC